MAPPDAVIRGFSRAQAWVYRRSHGRMWARFRGRPVLVLVTTGRRSGRPRATPLVYVTDGEAYVVTASNAGRDHDPGWVHNLRAAPRATVVVGGSEIPCAARFAEGDEAAGLWDRLVAHSPGFADYREQTARPFPVVVLTRR
jgi:deazaflavin-dependent oxidoreductase (nitroreductase family)